MSIKMNQYLAITILSILLFLDSASASDSKNVQRISNEIANTSSKLLEIETRTDKTEYAIETLSNKMEQLEHLQSISNEVIANGLSASERVVNIFGIMLALAAVGLGLYITWIQNRVKKLKDQVTQKEKSIKEMVKLINNDFDSLFERVRRADTKAMIERLVAVPQDICNIDSILLSRDLLPEDYQLLKKAFMKLLSTRGSKPDSISIASEQNYICLMIQHFFSEAIRDREIGLRLLPRIESWVSKQAFPNDLEKTAGDIAPFLKDKSSSIDGKDLLLKFLRGFSKSAYKDNKNLYDSIKRRIDNPDLFNDVEKMIIQK